MRVPGAGFAGRTLTLEDDKLVIESKKAGASFSDEYFYRSINPVVKTARRGETGWSNVIYGIVVASLALFMATRMTQSAVAKMIILALDYAALLFAAFLFCLQLKKSDYADFYDENGDCILSIKITPKSKPFIASLRQKIPASEVPHAGNA
jgi:hypothetical protein